MTTISARVIKCSVSEQDIVLTTIQVRYPKCIHGELMTHRVFSRNASSSRAVPVDRLIDDVMQNPFIPLYWGTNKKGMQAGEEAPNGIVSHADYGSFPVDEMWLKSRDEAVRMAKAFSNAGYHKQIVNRILEPYSHINVLITSTDWANFEALRIHPDAEPHMRALAEVIRDARSVANPILLKPGEWHLPYVEDDTLLEISEWLKHNNSVQDTGEIARQVSTAMCARLSYTTHEGKPSTVAGDLALYNRLVGSQPLHASPSEHQATPDKLVRTPQNTWQWENSRLHGNLRGYIQFRKTLIGEATKEKRIRLPVNT